MKDFLAFWGAGLSTALALVKGYELWRDRFRIELGYDFCGDPDIGNTITIRNLSSKPITITYRELLYRRPWHIFSAYNEVPDTNEPPYDVTIPAHSSESITYRGEAHFFPNGGRLKGQCLYLRLWIAGRGRQTYLVYDGAP